MILQALSQYYARKTRDGGGELAPPGFEQKEIPFVIVLDREGRFVDLDDTRSGEGKKKSGRISTVPQGEKKTSGIKANLLWDTLGYALGVVSTAKADKLSEAKRIAEVERAKEMHAAFVQRIRDAFPTIEDEGIRAVLAFLKSGDFQSIFHHSLWEELRQSTDNVSFRLQHDTALVCQRDAVRAALSHAGDADAVRQRCLVSGELDIIERLHPAIKGVWGAQTSGGNIVSFNRDAFNSYGKSQGCNAPVGKTAVFSYTTALNHLLRKGSRQRLQIGDASTVFWADKAHRVEDDFQDWIEADPDDPDRHPEAVRALYAAPLTGAGHDSADDTRFFVLGLAPNAARIAIRFWHQSTVAELAGHIRQHFDDLRITRGPQQPEFPTLSSLLRSIALQGERENIPPHLAGDVMYAVLAAMPYPRTLLSAVIRRIRAERRIDYVRAALIKAVLVRSQRFSPTERQEVDVSLALGNTNVGYRLGRLFAVLERAQEFANPGINATIRDRYYGAASATPVIAFPQLLKLKNFHIAKLDNRGLAVNLEKLIGEIMGGIVDFPAHLTMENQGRFAIGYYHQRQAFYERRGAGDEATTDDRSGSAESADPPSPV
ncbi:MAG: type I-C CRISPR-associated protein Cas8c/Csd1 [Gammaproteobacteria bacterium]